jgi:hypothetical protein
MDVMGTVVRLLATIALTGVLLHVPLSAQPQPPLTATDIARVKQEVTAAVNKYYTLFSAQDMKALPEQIYNVPWILMTGNGPQVDLTKEQAIARFEGSLKQLLESGWGKSVYTTTNVCVLSPAAAITSGYNTRYKKDGSVMSVGGVAYVFNRTKDGWRIVTYTSTSKDTQIKCD